MTTTVIERFMNRHGRISCCGVLSIYNATSIPKGRSPFAFVIDLILLDNFLA